MLVSLKVGTILILISNLFHKLIDASSNDWQFVKNGKFVKYFFKTFASKFITVDVTVYQNLTVIYLTFNCKLLKLLTIFYFHKQTILDTSQDLECAPVYSEVGTKRFL